MDNIRTHEDQHYVCEKRNLNNKDGEGDVTFYLHLIYFSVFLKQNKITILTINFLKVLISQRTTTSTCQQR